VDPLVVDVFFAFLFEGFFGGLGEMRSAESLTAALVCFFGPRACGVWKVIDDG